MTLVSHLLQTHGIAEYIAQVRLAFEHPHSFCFQNQETSSNNYKMTPLVSLVVQLNWCYVGLRICDVGTR